MSFGGDDLGEGDTLAARCIDSGFRIVENTLSPDESRGLLKTLDQPPASRGRAGARHLMAVPEIARLAHDSRLLSLARGELDGAAVPFRATLFEKSGKANWLVVWHQDTALPI